MGEQKLTSKQLYTEAMGDIRAGRTQPLTSEDFTIGATTVEELEYIEHIERVDRLSDYAHTAWSGWMEYLYAKSQRNDDGTITIPAELAKRWWRQMNTPYDLLSEEEKELDKKEARAILALL